MTPPPCGDACNFCVHGRIADLLPAVVITELQFV
jgi:hypothetical protein